VAEKGQFPVSPGVYLLSVSGPVDPATLPAQLGRIGFKEFIRPVAPTLPAEIVSEAPLLATAGLKLELEAKIVAAKPPTQVTLLTRHKIGAVVSSLPMQSGRGYRYSAALAPDQVAAGPLDYAIEATFEGEETARFPKGDDFSTITIADPHQPLILFDPLADAERWSFTRVSDSAREPQMEVIREEGAMKLMLPLKSDPTFKDYTLSNIIVDRVKARVTPLARPETLNFRARASADRKEAWLTLVEQDGTGWTIQLPLTTEWKDYSIPLRELKVGRSLKLPHPYPEMWWDYWCEPATGRGGPNDAAHIDHLERIQISHRQAEPSAPTTQNPWIEVGTITLTFRP
jgi:hypothetical protein